MGEGRVAVAVGGLGGGDLLVEVQGGVAALGAQKGQQLPGRVPGTGLEAVGDDEGARVDERIPRDAVLVLQLDQGVEGVAGGLAAHVLPELVTLAGQVQGQCEDLGDGLRGERLAPLPHPVHRAVQLGDGHAEPAGIERGEGRYVVGGPAAAGRALHLLGDALQDRQEGEGRRRCHDHHCASRSVPERNRPYVAAGQAAGAPLPATTSGRSSSARRSAGSRPFSSTSSATPRPVTRASLAMSVAAV